MEEKGMVELTNDFEGMELFEAVDFCVDQMISGAIGGSAELPDETTFDKLLLIKKALYKGGKAKKLQDK